MNTVELSDDLYASRLVFIYEIHHGYHLYILNVNEIFLALIFKVH